MAATVPVTRIEGGLAVAQGAGGRLQLQVAPPREFERRMIGKGALDAVFHAQQISADNGLSHALAALVAWERAASVPVAENGRLLREMMHLLSMVHAHLRHFYLAELGDYLPWASLAAYDGSLVPLRDLQAQVKERPKQDWLRQGFDDPFTSAERQRLWEHRALALQALPLIQRMLAMLGGKFPQVMSLVPGGVSAPLTAERLIRLRRFLREVRRVAVGPPLDDARLVVQRHPATRELGRGVPDFLCTGSGEEEAALDLALFPSGVMLAERLEPFAAIATESIHGAYYRIPPQGRAPGVATVPDPGKDGAYSWIKAPRYQGRPMEVGPYARLVITYLSGTRMSRPEFVDELEHLLGSSIRRSNSVAGRMLARMAELAALVERAEALLDQIDPAHPTVSGEGDPFGASGEGLALLEAPAGSVQHRLILERGRIAHYDVLSPGAWNGASQDEQGMAGSVETALNRAPADPGSAAGRRRMARIVHSFAFSATDATH